VVLDRPLHPGQAEPLRMRDSDNELLAAVSRIAIEDLALRPMLQRINQLLFEHFECALVAIVRVDVAEGRFVCEEITGSVRTEIKPGYERPLGSGVIGTVALSAETMIISDAREHGPETFVQAAEGIRSEICVPIIHRGELTGLLNLESLAVGAFDDAQLLVEAIASQISGAVASARVMGRLELAAGQLAHLNAVARIATESSQMDELLNRVTDYIAQAFDVDIASILVLDELGIRFVVEGYSGELELRYPRDGDWPVSEGVCGRCVRLGEPQLVLDVKADLDYVTGHPEVIEEYIVPIRHGRRILGVLNLENTHRGNFDDYQRLLYQNIAEQIAGSLNLISLLRKLEAMNVELQEISNKDSLTGIANRRRFDEEFEEEWSRARRHDHPLAVLLIDVDHFKAYNDSLGHQAGDECLRDIANMIKDAMSRAGETVARYGGEEFAVILPMVGEVGARETSERIRSTIEDASLLHPEAPLGHITVSIGGAAIVPRSGGRAALLALADEALYRAKGKGRNCVEIAHR
jgi:diguanylate cyclase (GGDEF)-like protein